MYSLNTTNLDFIHEFESTPFEIDVVAGNAGWCCSISFIGA